MPYSVHNMTLISRTVRYMSPSAIRWLKLSNPDNFTQSRGKTAQCERESIFPPNIFAHHRNCTFMVNLNFREWFVNVMNAQTRGGSHFTLLIGETERKMRCRMNDNNENKDRFSLIGGVQFKRVH